MTEGPPRRGTGLPPTRPRVPREARRRDRASRLQRPVPDWAKSPGAGRLGLGAHPPASTDSRALTRTHSGADPGPDPRPTPRTVSTADPGTTAPDDDRSLNGHTGLPRCFAAAGLPRCCAAAGRTRCRVSDHLLGHCAEGSNSATRRQRSSSAPAPTNPPPRRRGRRSPRRGQSWGRAGRAVGLGWSPIRCRTLLCPVDVRRVRCL